MDLPNIKNLNARGKRVLVRVDLNVPFRDGKIEDDYRIVRALPTIKKLVKDEAQVILMTHLSHDTPDALFAISNYLKKIFETVVFIPGIDLTMVKETVKTLVPGEVVILDNIRLFEGEEENSDAFAKELAGLADFYVNDALSVSHRNQASVVSVPKYLPHFAGRLFEEEYENLSRAFNPEHPFLLILGGVKFESKLGVLKRFLTLAENIFVGGGLANNFFRVLGEDVHDSVVDDDVNVLPYIGNPKISLPLDKKFKDGKILDLGPESVRFLAGLIGKAKFILWNGPLGSYEIPGFDWGTKEVAKLIAHSRARVIVGGGNTLEVLKTLPEEKELAKHAFLSTAGGAMLEFLANDTLPGIEALKNESQII